MVTQYLADGDLLVVEREDNAYLGAAAVIGDSLVLRNHQRSRPTSWP